MGWFLLLPLMGRAGLAHTQITEGGEALMLA